MLLAEGPDLFEFLLTHLLLPCLGAIVVFGGMAAIGNAIGPRISRTWRSSRFRRWWFTINGGGLCLFVGLAGNGLAVLMCLPLLRVREGSVIKPMSLPLIFIIIAAVTGVVGSRVSMNEDRPKGWMLFRVVGNVLCLTPLFVGCILMHWFAAIRDLTFG